jgi:hypothetical protein
MSAIAYGLITNQQLHTPKPITEELSERDLNVIMAANISPEDKERISQELAAQSGTAAANTDAKAALTSALVALVPAEALTLYNVALLQGIGVSVVGQGKTQQIVVADSMIATLMVAACILVAFAAYIITTKFSSPSTKLDYKRMWIPPAAAAAWLGLQQPSIVDSLDFGRVPPAGIHLVLLVLGVVATIAAAALGVTAKNQEPPTTRDQGDVARGGQRVG